MWPIVKEEWHKTTQKYHRKAATNNMLLQDILNHHKNILSITKHGYISKYFLLCKPYPCLLQRVLKVTSFMLTALCYLNCRSYWTRFQFVFLKYFFHVHNWKREWSWLFCVGTSHGLLSNQLAPKSPILVASSLNCNKLNGWTSLAPLDLWSLIKL